MPETYSKSPLVKKLAIKPKTRIIALNAPETFPDLLGNLPPETTAAASFEGLFNWILLFVKTQAELDDQLPAVIEKLAADGILWLSFLRDKKATDLSRSSMGVIAEKYPLDTVANAVINDDWTAYRLKRIES